MHNFSLERQKLLQTWQWLETHAALNGIDRYEMSERGEVLLGPCRSATHQSLCANLALQISSQLGGTTGRNVAVVTPTYGIRVPEIIWMPASRWAHVDSTSPLPWVPEVCVKVMSAATFPQETERKIRAYLEGGAKEVILVGRRGEVDFRGQEGRLNESSLGLRLVLEASLFVGG